VKKVDGKGDPRRPAIEGGMPTRGEPLPFCRASIDDRDVAAVVETVSSGWLTVGPRTEELERRLADYLSVRHVVAVSSCSEAMFLALSALGVGPGDEVITSCLTFASTVHAIVHTGARPVLADVEMETFGLDPAHVESLITPATRAILPVHFGGQACRIEEIVDLAGRRGLHVVEDAAHSFGAEVGGTPLGAFGDATAFSFYATKNLTTGEGGAISTDSDELAERLRLLSYHGMSRDSWTRYTDRGSWYYQVELPGYKCNLNDMQAARARRALPRAAARLPVRRSACHEGREHTFLAPLRGATQAGTPLHRPRQVHPGDDGGEHWHVGPLHPSSSPSVLRALSPGRCVFPAVRRLLFALCIAPDLPRNDRRRPGRRRAGAGQGCGVLRNRLTFNDDHHG
jgi:dTDP-4-amino-4,6-dideoxygalactose transaminase